MKAKESVSALRANDGREYPYGDFVIITDPEEASGGKHPDCPATVSADEVDFRLHVISARALKPVN